MYKYFVHYKYYVFNRLLKQIIHCVHKKKKLYNIRYTYVINFAFVIIRYSNVMILIYIFISHDRPMMDKSLNTCTY